MERITHSIVRAYSRQEVAFLEGQPRGDFRPAGYWLPEEGARSEERGASEGTEQVNAELQSANNPHDYLPPVDEHMPAVARSEDRGASIEQNVSLDPKSSLLDPDLPFEIDPQHSCNYGSDRKPKPASQITMADEQLLTEAFFEKHSDATAVEIVRRRRSERPSNTSGRRKVTYRYEVWITLAAGHTIIERSATFDELMQIAERR